MRMHQSYIPQDKIAVIPNLLHFSKSSSMFERQQQLKLTWSDKDILIASILPIHQKTSYNKILFVSIFPTSYDIIWWGYIIIKSNKKSLTGINQREVTIVNHNYERTMLINETKLLSLRLICHLL